jgi:Leucine-rich repeat (LRR) protein
LPDTLYQIEKTATFDYTQYKLERTPGVFAGKENAMTPKRALAAALICLSLLFAAGCSILEPEAAATPAPTAPATQLDQSNQNLTDADLTALYAQTQLVSLDLRGNALSVEAVQSLQAALPSCDILWSIPLGSAQFDSNSTQIVLPADTAASELSRLSLFPALTTVDASAVSDSTALKAVAAEMPNLAISWNIDVLGQSYPSTTTSLDLTSATITDAASLSDALLAFPRLESVDLTGLELSPDVMSALAAALPETQFIWSVDLFGVTVDSLATEADISDIPIESVEAVSQKLALLPNLTELVMCNCGLTNEQMEQLLAAHPTVKFVWLIQVGGWELRTDAKAFSKGNRKTFDGGEFIGGKTNFTSEDLEPLKYCTDLIALDLGHGSRITDLSILQYLPKLRFLILAMNRITDISPLTNCPDLEYLEIFQNYISDWSPLLSLKKLTHLNCSTNYGKDADGGKTYPDYTVLKQMTQLERIWIIRSGLGASELADLRAALPNAVINNVGSHSTSNGWRDNDLYVEMQGLFNLPLSE